MGVCGKGRYRPPREPEHGSSSESTPPTETSQSGSSSLSTSTTYRDRRLASPTPPSARTPSVYPHKLHESSALCPVVQPWPRQSRLRYANFFRRRRDCHLRCHPSPRTSTKFSRGIPRMALAKKCTRRVGTPRASMDVTGRSRERN